MTPEQQKDAKRLERYITREGLASVMNKTKWRETFQLLQDLMGYNVRFRIKDVRGPEPRSDWEGSFPYHVPRPYKTIEWFEVNPVVEHHRGALLAPEVQDFTVAIVETFQSKGIPFYQENGIIRIQGYTRTGQSEG